ncbi:MAG: GNAT family N-acetyltransferase [Bacteroidetes bacterium]|nr:GNAT family N-acetyltransferase [Bacteroidota bacterium]
MQIEEYHKEQYLVSSDPAKLDLRVIHAYLSRSYWAEDIPFETVKRSVEHSLCFGVYNDKKQIGFARVISDYTTFAYLADVFILEEERGKGLSKFLMECILKHKELQGLRNFSLMTQDAHSLYARYGFKNIPKPENFMAKKIDGIYKKKK